MTEHRTERRTERRTESRPESRPAAESQRAAEAHEHGRVKSEVDRIAAGPIVAVGIGALVLFFLASWATIGYLRVKEGDRPPLPVPAEFGQSKVALVEQQLFELSARGARERDAQRERLGSYGWVDRKAGIVRLPIGRAMELSAKGIRPRASAPPPATPEAQP
ncbi:MAG TPA: hypothetical protein VF912_17455 [Anaeromyxobacter sp.]